MPRLAAITGGIGSGKSTAAGAFVEAGIPTLDVDALSRSLSARGGAAIDAIVSAFSADMLDVTGALDRAKMRQLVFSDASAKHRLEAILHPMIRKGVNDWLTQIDATTPLAALEIPLLYEGMSYRDQLWRTIVVDCPTREQIARVMSRSGLGADEVKRILAAQLPRSIRLQIADYVLPNVGGLAQLEAHAHNLATMLLRTVCD